MLAQERLTITLPNPFFLSALILFGLSVNKLVRRMYQRHPVCYLIFSVPLFHVREGRGPHQFKFTFGFRLLRLRVKKPNDLGVSDVHLYPLSESAVDQERVFLQYEEQLL